MKVPSLLRGTVLLFLCMLSLQIVYAQSFPVKGTIVSSTGQPLAGVTVSVKGSSVSTVTQADGTYSINAPSAASTLVFSYVGFAEQEIPVNNKGTIDVSLLQSDAALGDVVVVGYGTRKRADVTGAISSITGDDLRSVQTTNITSALQGRIAGVVATPSTFRPGGGSSIRIRGNRSLNANNEPLYVVDGFPVSYTIDDMNPADIESIDVLKDASATAIYGVRGANGVVQITTRKGKAGKISVNYQGSESIDKIIRPLPIFDGAQIADAWRQAFFADRSYTNTRGIATASNPLYYYPTASADVALFLKRFGSVEQWYGIKDAYTWRQYDFANNIFIAQKRATTPEERAVLQNLGLSQIDSIDMYDPSKVRSYDWLNEVGLRNGMTHNHNISVTGGGEKFKASLNAGYMKQTGIEYAQDYTRYTIGNSTEFKPVKYLTFGTTINYINSTTNNSTSSYGNASGMIPLVTPYDSAGNWLLYPNGDAQIRSAINDRNTVEDNTIINRVFGNVYGELTLFKHFKYRTMFGLDTRNSRRGTFNGAQSSVRLGSAATASQTTSNSTSWVYDNILTYSNTFGDHSLNVTALQELQNLNRSSSLTMSANNLIYESQKWYSLDRNTDAQVTGSGTYSASQYLSYMGRIEYGYKNKYMLTVSARYDNSSVLSEDNKGAYFPSASLAWQIDREGFFEKQNIFSSAKFRVGVGVVGNASIDPYQTGGPLSFTNYSWGNGTAAIGAAPSTFATPNLGWEKTTTYNAGIDFGLFRSRIVGTVDVYNTSTKDQLQNKSIPGANGVTNVFVNLGEINNKGIEISLSTRNIVQKDFQWSTDFIFTRNKEKIVDIDGSGNSNYANLWLLDQPLQVYWGYQKEGIFQYDDTAAGKGILSNYYWQKAGNRSNTSYQPGHIRILDANGDTAFSPADRVILGSHNPDFTASIGNTVTYKNFDLNFLFYFRVGGLYRVPRPGLVGRYQSNYVNYWTPTNPSNDYQQPTQTSDIPLYWEALTYRKATFVKLRNVSLTYRIPSNVTRKIYANNIAVYFNAINPILFHKSSDYDPETIPYREFPGNTTSQTGPTSYSYRSFVLGIRLDM